jgi:hypothetical protein
MAAKKTISASSSFKERGSTKRKGIHSKTKMSKNKAFQKLRQGFPRSRLVKNQDLRGIFSGKIFHYKVLYNNIIW